MNPLCVTWSPLRPTELGRKNLQAFIDSGFNSIVGSPNPHVSARLTWESFKELGDPFSTFYLWPDKFSLANCS